MHQLKRISGTDQVCRHLPLIRPVALEVVLYNVMGMLYDVIGNAGHNLLLNQTCLYSLQPAVHSHAERRLGQEFHCCCIYFGFQLAVAHTWRLEPC